MRHTLTATALTAAAALTAGGAHAQTASDWMPWNWVRGDETYFSVKGSSDWMQNADLGGPDLEMNNGWGGNVAVGRYLNKNTRAEVELGYYTSGVDKVKTSTGNVGADGDVTAMTGMLNAYYEPFAECRIKPYVGAGIGVANVDADSVSAAGTAVADGDDTVFAGQVMAGASYQFTPSTALTAEYRYLQTADADIDTPTGSTDMNYQNHMAMLGLRVKF